MMEVKLGASEELWSCSAVPLCSSGVEDTWPGLFTHKVEAGVVQAEGALFYQCLGPHDHLGMLLGHSGRGVVQ